MNILITTYFFINGLVLGYWYTMFCGYLNRKTAVTLFIVALLGLPLAILGTAKIWMKSNRCNLKYTNILVRRRKSKFKANG